MARYLRNTVTNAITVVQDDDDATWHTLLAQKTTPPDANTSAKALYEQTSEAWVLQHGGSSSTAVSAGSSGGLTPTPVKTAAYTAVPGDLVRVDTTSGPVTVTLPAAAAGAAPIGVKLVTLGGSNAVTIAAAGSDVFNKAGGSTTLTLSLLNQGVVLAPLAGVWVAQSDDLPLSQLDARYRAASGITFTPTGTVAATDVQAAVAEVASEAVQKTVVDTSAAVDGQPLIYDSIAGKFKPRNLLPGIKALAGLAPALTRAQPPFGTSDAVQQQGQCRLKHTMLVAANSIRLVYVNWEVQQGTSQVSTITVRAGFEDPGGNAIPITFNGQRTVVIDPGGFAISDPIVIDNPGPTGQFPYFYSRTLVTVATAGQRFPTLTIGGSATTAASGDGYEYGASLTDKTLSGSMTNSGLISNNWYGPSAIVADCPARNPVVFAYGDSIVAGTGDTPTAAGLVGWAARALGGAGIPFVQVGRPSELTIDTFAYVNGLNYDSHSQFTAGAWSRFYKTLWMSGCSHVIVEHGVNDLNPSLVTVPTLAAFQATELGYWKHAANRGGKVYAPTLTPHTTSTDSWATTGNQTINNSGENTVRTGYNDWLRDGAPIDATTKAAVAVGTATNVLRIGASGHYLTGYLEIADAVETSRNSGIWKAANTSDGIHPNATGSAAAATAVNAAATFTV